MARIIDSTVLPEPRKVPTKASWASIKPKANEVIFKKSTPMPTTSSVESRKALTRASAEK